VKQKVDKPQSKNVSVRNAKAQGSTADHYLFVGECHVEGLMNGEAIEALNSRRDFAGPIDPDLVVQEILEKAGQPIPKMGWMSDAEDLDKNEKLQQIVQAGRAEVNMVTLGQMEKKWFDIR
jgi:hypothetical protein